MGFRDECSTSLQTEFYDTAKMSNNFYYYITTNEISVELSAKNMISSVMKRSLLLWLHDEFFQPKIFLSEMACTYFIVVYLLNRTLHCHLDTLNFPSSVEKYFMSEGSMIFAGMWP